MIPINFKVLSIMYSLKFLVLVINVFVFVYISFWVPFKIKFVFAEKFLSGCQTLRDYILYIENYIQFQLYET